MDLLDSNAISSNGSALGSANSSFNFLKRVIRKFSAPWDVLSLILS